MMRSVTGAVRYGGGARRRVRPRGSGVATVAAVLAALLTSAAPASAHGVDHRVSREGAAMVVSIAYADGTPLSHESCEVFRPGESVPFVTGRTDAHGRVLFLPDTTGSWRVRMFTADGHGLDVTVEAGSAEAVDGSGGAAADRVPRLLGGLAILFGAFALMGLFYGRMRGGGG